MYQYSFEKLVVWQDSIALVLLIYTITKEFPSEEKFGLTSQLRRATVSISSNIAEGTSRTTNKDKARFITIAFSSTMEVLNQIIISKKLNFITETQYQELREIINKVANKLNALKKFQLKQISK